MTERLRLLLIEDSDDDAQLILREVRHGGFEVESLRVETPDELSAALSDREWDLVMCDYSLPQFTALDALEILKASGLDLPVLIISGTIGEESAVTALKRGAHDFLIKGNLPRLVPAIRRELADAGVRRQHRRAQAALEESEARFRAWIEYSSDLVTVTDREGHIQYESPSGEHLLGYPHGELLGRNLADLVHPHDTRKISALLSEDGAEGAEVASAEFRLRHQDGTWRDFEGSRRVYRDAQGAVSFIINSRDITERKQRGRELEAIASLTASLRAARSLQEILSHLLVETLSMTECDAGSIWLHDATTGEIHQAVQTGWPEAAPIADRRRKDVPSLVVAAGEAITVREFCSDPRVAPENRDHFPPGMGGVCLPLRTGEGIVGVMCVFTNLPRELTAGEMRVLAALAEIGGSAIQRMILFEQSVRQVEQLAALRAIDLAITGSFDLRLSLNTILEHVIKQLNIDCADVLLLSPETQNLKYGYGRGFKTRRIESTVLRLGQGFAGRSALQREIIFVEDLSKADGSFHRSELVKEESFVSYCVVPLLAKGRVEGVLEIFNRAMLTPSYEWREYLEALAGQAAIAIDNVSLFRELQQSNFELAIAYDATIEGWSHALDLRDRDTEGHTQRVTEASLRLARHLNVQEDELTHMKRGALLHDIGKMGVPDSILHKPGPLTDKEWEVMRQHPQYAHDMLTPISFLRRALDIPYAHHEWWDGTGYPRGLRGERIPLVARIFSVVDVWDALTSTRPYRTAWPEQEALEHIQAGSGSHFDPRVVSAFMKVVASGEADS